jgi:uncharacterized protein
MLLLTFWDALLSPGWMILLWIIFGAILGAIAGFFISRNYFKAELKKNPPINEKMIRVMFQQMGQKPSEARIRSIMAEMNRVK